MGIKDKLLSKIKNEKMRSVVGDPKKRARITFILSLLPTLVFVGFNAVTGIVHRSIWHGSLAIYYILFIAQKISLIIWGSVIYRKYVDNEELYEKKKTQLYLINGIFILLVELGLTAAIVQMATTKNPAQTGFVIAIATAAYAFFKLILALVNLKKSAKASDPMLQVIRNIGLVSALVSMLALTSTMISTFGDFTDMRPTFVGVAIGVSVITIGLGVFMIIKGVVKLVQSKMQE